jgi:hypothetical protein
VTSYRKLRACLIGHRKEAFHVQFMSNLRMWDYVQYWPPLRSWRRNQRSALAVWETAQHLAANKYRACAFQRNTPKYNDMEETWNKNSKYFVELQVTHTHARTRACTPWERGAGRPGLNFRQRQGIINFSTMSKPHLGSSQPPIKWVLAVKRPGREDDQSQVDSKRIWRWCITLRITKFLDFSHHPVF